MPLDISKLTRFDVGREVTYRSGPDVDHGHISSWDDKLVFVHFHRGSTAASCKPESLEFSMGYYSEDGGESVEEILEEIDELRKTILRHRELALVSHEKGDDEKLFGHAQRLNKASKVLSRWSQQLISAQLAEGVEVEGG